MKLVLQVFVGIILAAVAIKAATYSYDRYSHRSTANQYEWAAARDFLGTLAKTCPGVLSSGQCAKQAIDACSSFHINESDCSDLVTEALQKRQQPK